LVRWGIAPNADELSRVRAQYKISSLLAEDYPQLAFDVFSAAWHRITTTGIHGHAHMLFYLPPWLEAIDFAVLPPEATVSLLEVRARS
jgi:hypothetical protein